MEDISFEEVITYFLNHVMRWLYLALGLRKLGWDRLFYQTAQLIKIQAAIQEIESRYNLADHHMWDQ